MQHYPFMTIGHHLTSSYKPELWCFNICSQAHQGGPKVEKVFFTTAIPVGANAGKLMSSELLYFFMLQ